MAPVPRQNVNTTAGQWGTIRHQVEGQREQGGTSWKKQWTPEEWTGSGWTFGAQSCLQLLTAGKPSQGSAAVQGLWACPPWLRLARRKTGSDGRRQCYGRAGEQLAGEAMAQGSGRIDLLCKRASGAGCWSVSAEQIHNMHGRRQAGGVHPGALHTPAIRGDAAPSLPAPRACPTVHGARPSVDPVCGLGVDCDAGGHHKAWWKHRALHGTRQQLTHQLSEPGVAGCCGHPRQGQVIQQAVARGCSTTD